MNLNPMHSPDLDRSMTTGTGTTTGSWAQSTHSVIWRTNTGTPSHRMVGERIPWRPTLIACAAVALTVLLACANLVDVYGSFGLWAAAAVPAALIGAGVAAMSVLPTLRVWWQLVALVVAQWILGPVICCNGTTLAHVVPTAATLRDGWSATFGSFKYLISIAPSWPNGSSGRSSAATARRSPMWCRRPPPYVTAGRPHSARSNTSSRSRRRSAPGRAR